MGPKTVIYSVDFVILGYIDCEFRYLVDCVNPGRAGSWSHDCEKAKIFEEFDEANKFALESMPMGVLHKVISSDMATIYKMMKS